MRTKKKLPNRFPKEKLSKRRRRRKRKKPKHKNKQKAVVLKRKRSNRKAKKNLLTKNRHYKLL